jgi:pimeloyl-ACP methyl ester carboxylesterase
VSENGDAAGDGRTDLDDVFFESGGERLAAWHLVGEGDAFERDGRRPCVVMAHGFGGTRDSGLLPFAKAFAATGLDALVFDYRTFGASSGEPRQLIHWGRHREDYAAAVAFARTLDGVDPDRIVLWGSSYSGGHVLPVAADDGRVAAVISQVPATDGLAALLEVGRYAGPVPLLRLTALGALDAVRGLIGREPLRVPIVGPPGTLAAMTSPDAEPGFLAIAGPTFRNEFCARAALDAARNRPIARAADLPCPVLFIIADRDTVAPPSAVEKAAWKAPGRAEVRRYPLGHFDVYLGEGFERAVGDQLYFLRRHLGVREAAAVA